MGARKGTLSSDSGPSTPRVTTRNFVLFVILVFAIVINMYWWQFWKQEYSSTPHSLTGPSAPSFDDWKKASLTKINAIPHFEAVAGLQCHDHGGPTDSLAAEEMVYWRDIPKDASFASPFRSTASSSQRNQYLTFEPDEGGVE
jgi:hypothetical protein